MANVDMVAIEGWTNGLPDFVRGNVVKWCEDLYMAKMAKDSGQLGFEHAPVYQVVALGGVYAAGAAGRTQFAKDLEKWVTRKDSCISSMHTACRKEPDAAEQIAQYMREKAMLPVGHANKMTLASELRSRLIARFRDEIADELGKLNADFASFHLSTGEKVYSGVDRLNGIIQKLTELNAPPTEAANLSKLRDAINLDRLEVLWMTVSMLPNLTYAELCATCKRYDIAEKKKAERQTREEVNMITPEKNKRKRVDANKDALDDCSHCGKPGHPASQCFTRLKEQKAAKLKRANRAREKEKHNGVKPTGQKPGSKEYSGCHGCGSKSHRKYDCPKPDASKKRKKKGLEAYVRKGEDDDSDSDSDED
jgi:hypothetical protein